MAVEDLARKYLAGRFGADRVVSKPALRKFPANLNPDRPELAATGTIVDALLRDPDGAFKALRASLTAGVPADVVAYAERLLGNSSGDLLLVWNRGAARGHGADRVMTLPLLQDIVRRAQALGFTPVILGEVPEGGVKALSGKVIDMTVHHAKLPDPQAQLMLFEYLRRRGVAGQIGMMSGGMDQAAFIGMPTLSIAAKTPTDRMGHVALALPTFREVTPEGVQAALATLVKKNVAKPPMQIPRPRIVPIGREPKESE